MSKRSPSATSNTQMVRDSELDDEAVPPAPRRINVAVNSDMLAAIDHVIEREQISLTEAVRRLIAYGDFIYRAVKDDQAAIVLRSDQGGEREVILV